MAKKLKKIYVITGAANSGKTRIAKEIARRLIVKLNATYEDWLQKQPNINQSTGTGEYNDDIFGLIKGIDVIGVATAGDDENDVVSQITLLKSIYPDVIICTARTTSNGNSAILDEVKKQFDKESSKLITEVPTTDFDISDQKGCNDKIDEIVEDILSTLRGF